MVKLRSLRTATVRASFAGALMTLAVVHATPGLADPPADSGNPSSGEPLAVSQVKLTHGLRVSRLIGAAVYNDGNQQIGTVDDLILTQDAKAVMAVLQVGGFLGVGGKLVAVPYDKLHVENGNNDNKNAVKVVMPGASKEELSQLPSFSYGS